jgi:hypothetical protein
VRAPLMTSRAPLRNQKGPNRAPIVEFLRAPADLQGEASVFLFVFFLYMFLQWVQPKPPRPKMKGLLEHCKFRQLGTGFHARLVVTTHATHTGFQKRGQALSQPPL